MAWVHTVVTLFQTLPTEELGLKIQGQLMLACVQPGRPLTPKKKRVHDFFWEGAVSTYATLIPPNLHSG